MGTIRDQLERHQLISAIPLGQGRCAILISELTELVELAHQAVHSNPAKPNFTFEEIFEELSDDEDEPEIERSVNEHDQNIRATAMHYAVAVDTTRIQASHGLESYSDPIGLAQSIYEFLKG